MGGAGREQTGEEGGKGGRRGGVRYIDETIIMA